MGYQADGDIDDSITFGTFGYTAPSHGTLTYTDSQTSRSLQLTDAGRLHVNQTIHVGFGRLPERRRFERSQRARR
jgi:hypothetical protein